MVYSPDFRIFLCCPVYHRSVSNNIQSEKFAVYCLSAFYFYRYIRVFNCLFRRIYSPSDHCSQLEYPMGKSVELTGCSLFIQTPSSPSAEILFATVYHDCIHRYPFMVFPYASCTHSNLFPDVVNDIPQSENYTYQQRKKYFFCIVKLNNLSTFAAQ